MESGRSWMGFGKVGIYEGSLFYRILMECYYLFYDDYKCCYCKYFIIKEDIHYYFVNKIHYFNNFQ